MQKPLLENVLDHNKGIEGSEDIRLESHNLEGDRLNYRGGRYAAHTYQCVEYVRRWLLLVKYLDFAPLVCACNIWDIKTVRNVRTREEMPIVRIAMEVLYLHKSLHFWIQEEDWADCWACRCYYGGRY